MSAGPALAPQAGLDQHDQQAWRDGLRDSLPTLFGIVAWGMVVGIAMVKSGLSASHALGMTVFVLAGSAQLAAIPLIAAGTPIWIVFATALVVNLRFVIFSALLAPHFAHLPWRQRLALGYYSGDLTVAMFLQRYPDTARTPGKLSYMKALLICNGLAWQLGSWIGVGLGAVVPAAWGLGFAGTLAIICIMVPLVVNRAALCGVAVAVLVSVGAHALPYKLGLLLAVLAGMLAALTVSELGAPTDRTAAPP
jgi:predicted branched-subunit amino acid permease